MNKETKAKVLATTRVLTILAAGLSILCYEGDLRWVWLTIAVLAVHGLATYVTYLDEVRESKKIPWVS